MKASKEMHDALYQALTGEKPIVPDPRTKYQKHLDLCNEFHATYQNKNDDYGDAFSKLWAETGFIAGYTKIADKFYRIQSLRKKGEDNRKVNETMRDSLMDLANYCMMCVMEMDNAEAVPTEIVDPNANIINHAKGLQLYYKEQGWCPHGYEDWDKCPDCCH